MLKTLWKEGLWVWGAPNFFEWDGCWDVAYLVLFCFFLDVSAVLLRKHHWRVLVCPLTGRRVTSWGRRQTARVETWRFTTRLCSFGRVVDEPDWASLFSAKVLDLPISHDANLYNQHFMVLVGGGGQSHPELVLFKFHFQQVKLLRFVVAHDFLIKCLGFCLGKRNVALSFFICNKTLNALVLSGV